MRLNSERPGSRFTRLTLVFGLAVLALALAAPALGAADQPSFVGLSYEEARSLATEGDLDIDWVPQDFDADDSVVAVIAQEGDINDRYFMLILGTFVPELEGELGSDIEAIVSRHDLRLEVDGELAEDWRVAFQAPPPGTLVGFGGSVLAQLEPVGIDRDSNGEPPWLWIGLIGVIGGGALLTHRLRKSRRPGEHRDPDEPPEAPRGRVWTRIEPGLPDIEVAVPHDGPAGRVIRVAPTIDAGTHDLEEIGS